MWISEEEKNVGKTTKVNLKPRKCKAICEGKYRRQAIIKNALARRKLVKITVLSIIAER